MKASDVTRLSYGAFKQRRLRSALTVLGIMIGAAVVVGLVSATEGVSDAIVGELSKLSADVIMVSPASASARLTSIDERLIASVSNVKTVVPVHIGMAQVTSGRESKDLQLFGLDQTYLPSLLKGLKIDQGAFVSRFDAGGVLLGAKVANPIGATSPFARLNQAVSVEVARRVGEEIEISRRTFIVRGITVEYGTAFIVNIDNVACVSLDAARTLLGRTSYSVIFVMTSSPDHVDQVADRLKEIYGENMDIITSKQILDIVQSITGVLTIFLGGIAAISLIVAGIGIANIMFVSVMERTREIGVLKALGFKRFDILWLFLSEALLTGAIGGIFGCGLGILFGYGITSFFGGGFGGIGEEAGGAGDGGFQGDGGFEITIVPSFTPELIVIAIGFAVLIAAIAGLYPSWKASKLNPVDALRAE